MCLFPSREKVTLPSSLPDTGNIDCETPFLFFAGLEHTLRLTPEETPFLPQMRNALDAAMLTSAYLDLRCLCP